MEVAPRYKLLYTVDIVDTVYTIETALHCYNISMYACIYC